MSGFGAKKQPIVFVLNLSHFFSVTAALPRYIGEVASSAGLPASSVPTYIRAVTGNNATLALTAPGVTTELFALGRRARLDAYVYR